MLILEYVGNQKTEAEKFELKFRMYRSIVRRLSDDMTMYIATECTSLDPHVTECVIGQEVAPGLHCKLTGTLSPSLLFPRTGGPARYTLVLQKEITRMPVVLPGTNIILRPRQPQ